MNACSNRWCLFHFPGSTNTKILVYTYIDVHIAVEQWPVEAELVLTRLQECTKVAEGSMAVVKTFVARPTPFEK